jgi:hypothetical protein
MLGEIVRQRRVGRSEHPVNILFSFRILATSGDSGLVETITDAVSIHSIKKAEYGRRLAEGRLGHVSLMDHFKAVGHFTFRMCSADVRFRLMAIPALPSLRGLS